MIIPLASVFMYLIVSGLIQGGGKWGVPYTVLLMTPTAVRVEGWTTRAHRAHWKTVPPVGEYCLKPSVPTASVGLQKGSCCSKHARLKPAKGTLLPPGGRHMMVLVS